MKIVQVINAMISNKNKISNVIRDENEFFFLYDEKFEVDEIDKQIREHEEAIKKLKSKKKKND